MKTGFFTAAFTMLALAACQTFAQGLLRPDNKRVLGTNNIIAVVEDRVITRAEVMKEVEPFIPQIRGGAFGVRVHQPRKRLRARNCPEHG